MTEIDQKRAFVADLYPGPGWKEKVKQMPDAQVIAIYMREKNREHPNRDEPKKPKESDGGDIPF